MSAADKLSFVKIRANGGVSVLLPGDDDAKAAIDRLKNEREVIVTLKTARNPKQHRTFFAVLKVLVDHEVFETTEVALMAVKVALGEMDNFVDASTGQVFYVLRSISFESCSQDRFGRLFEDTLRLVCDRWLVGTDVEDLRRKVEEIVEDKAAASLGARQHSRWKERA